MTTAVLGAGALGLTLAYRLAQAGEPVEVFEGAGEPGGLAAGFQVGGTYLEKFYHHLFGTDRAAIALITELGLGDQLLWLRPQSSILYQGGMYPMDSIGAVLRFPPLSLLNRLRLGAVTAYLKVERNYHRLEHMTASAWLQRWMGGEPYRVVWEPLMRSKFGAHADSILMSWMWARLHYRTAKLGYLRGGFQQLYQRLVEAIQRHGGTVHLGESVRRVAPRTAGGYDVLTDKRSSVFDLVVSTAPTHVTFQLAPDLPAEFRQQFDQVLAYGAPPQDAAMSLRPFDIYAKELTIVGSYAGTYDTWPRAIALLAGGRFDPSLIVDSIRPLGEAVDAIKDLEHNRSIVKTHIQP